MTSPKIWSQRLIRKGPLVEETYRLFAGWDFDTSIERNLHKGLHGKFKTLGWEKEVATTIGRRLKDFVKLKSLIVLAQANVSFADWRDCWRLWVGATEEPFNSFAIDWLYAEYESGRYHLMSEDLRVFVKGRWKLHSPNRPLTDDGCIRTARDLVRTATDLGMLSGKGPKKAFAPIAMGDNVVLFYAHMIAELEGSISKVANSRLWRLAFMAPADVHAAFLRLHQYKRVNYQVAGSLIELVLPSRSALAYSESLAA